MPQFITCEGEDSQILRSSIGYNKGIKISLFGELHEDGSVKNSFCDCKKNTEAAKESEKKEGDQKIIFDLPFIKNQQDSPAGLFCVINRPFLSYDGYFYLSGILHFILYFLSYLKT